MKKLLAAAMSLAMGVVFSTAALALPAELSGAPRLFSCEQGSVYGVYEPKADCTLLYLSDGETAKNLGKIENSGLSFPDFAVIGDKAYGCFQDPGGEDAIRLMRVGLKDGTVAKAAEFQNASHRIYVEPAGGKLLIYGRENHDETLPMTKYTCFIDLYDPATGVLKPVVALESMANDRLSIPAATYDQGAIFAIAERSKDGALTYSLRKYSMDGKLESETALPAAFAAPGGKYAATMGVSGDYVKVNNGTNSVLFRISTGKALYDGPCLEYTPADGKAYYTDRIGNVYLLDMAAGTFVKSAGAAQSSAHVEAYTAMVAFLEQCHSIHYPFLAFDTTSLTFAEGEQEAFLQKMRMAYPKSQLLYATLDELTSLGYTDTEGAFISVRYGALITIRDVTFQGDTVRFSISSFVSGMGGYYITGAEMQNQNGVWTVTNEGKGAIS